MANQNNTFLRARLNRVILIIITGLVLLALSLFVMLPEAITLASIIAALAAFILITGFIRLFNKRSYLTTLTPDAMIVRNARGKVVNKVAWSDIEEIFPRAPATILALGKLTEPCVAWSLNKPSKPHGMFAYTKGGKIPFGKSFDGFLPDPYLGYDKTSQLIVEYITRYKNAG
jgi:hypothetical protein